MRSDPLLRFRTEIFVFVSLLLLFVQDLRIIDTRPSVDRVRHGDILFPLPREARSGECFSVEKSDCVGNRDLVHSGLGHDSLLDPPVGTHTRITRHDLCYLSPIRSMIPTYCLIRF